MKFQREGLDVDYIETFLGEADSKIVFEECSKLAWKGTRRENITFSRVASTYTVSYSGRTYSRITRSWSEFPIVEVLVDLVQKFTGKTYNYCAIMRYPSGSVGIHTHRDKEMIPGTTICGFSVGASRTLVFHPPSRISSDDVKIKLGNGSLYVMNPPTNDRWTHEIPVEADVTGVRFSLTFRDMKLT